MELEENGLTGAIAREWRCPSAERVVSMLVLAADAIFVTSWNFCSGVASSNAFVVYGSSEAMIAYEKAEGRLDICCGEHCDR
jgi:hypothetical protein